MAAARLETASRYSKRIKRCRQASIRLCAAWIALRLSSPPNIEQKLPRFTHFSERRGQGCAGHRERHASRNAARRARPGFQSHRGRGPQARGRPLADPDRPTHAPSPWTNLKSTQKAPVRGEQGEGAKRPAKAAPKSLTLWNRKARSASNLFRNSSRASA